MSATSLDALQSALPGLRWTEVAPRELPPLPAPGAPLNPLRRAVRRAARPLFLVNDSARILARDLPDILAELWSLAREPRLLVATGTHRDDPARAQDRLGGLPVELHDADDAAAHGALGRWRFDRRVLEADLVVACGSVEPHYFAGWTGAHKTATVGVWSRDTIAANHHHALSAAAQPTALEGNPVFADLAAAADALARDRRLLALNHVLDDLGRPLGAGVGTWRGSLNRAIPVARQRMVQPLAPVELLVAEVSGPWARSLYQADKGVKNHEAVVAAGGELLLLAPLPDGVGSRRFVDLLRRAPDLAAAEALVADEGYTLGDHKAVRWRALEARGVTVRIVSAGLDPAEGAAAGLRLYPDLPAALAAVETRSGRAALVRDAAASVCSPW